MSRLGIGPIVGFVTEHSLLTLVVMLLLTGGVAAGVPQLDTENQAAPDSESFQHLQRIEASQYIQANYSQSRGQNTTIAKVYVRNESGNVLSKASLLDGLRYQRAVRENASVAATLRGDGIVGLSNLVATRAANATNPGLRAQIAALEATSASEVDSLVEATLSENPRAKRFLPTGHGQSTTAHDRRMLVTLDARVPESTLTNATATLFRTANERPGFFTLGERASGEFTSHVVGQTVELVVPVSLLLILLVLAFAYRDFVDVVVGMVGVGLAVLWMFGIMGWLGVAAGVISIIPVVLLTGLSVDFSFHVFNRYREERGPDDGIRDPMNRGVRYVTTALLLVTVTAAIGFLANLANPLALIRNLGVSITLGVVSALVLFTTVVPALKITIDELLERAGIDRQKQALGRGQYLKPVLAGSVRLARKAAPLVVVLAIVGAAVGGAAWTALEQEQFTGREGEVADWKQQLPDPVGWEPHGYQQRSAHVETTYQPVGAGDTALSSLLVEGDVTSGDTLEDVHAGVKQLEQAGIVLESGRRTPVRSPVTAMRAVARRDAEFGAAFRRADSDGNGVPDTDLKSLYDAFYAADSEVASQVVERRNGEYQSLLVLVTLDSADRSRRDSYVGTLTDGASTMEDGGERTVTVAGQFAVTQAILNELQSGILLTMGIALAAIIVALTVVFRFMHGSASLGAVVGVPIVLVVGFVIGGMYLLSIPLNLLTALLMSLVIGVGVDYNIHLGDRFADELRADKRPYAALRAAVTGTGGALLGSTLTSVGAFTTLLLLPDPGLRSFGAIVVLALSLAFLTSVLVLPSALALWSRFTANDLTRVSEASGSREPAGDAISQD